jgi:hypothetical protein
VEVLELHSGERGINPGNMQEKTTHGHCNAKKITNLPKYLGSNYGNEYLSGKLKNCSLGTGSHLKKKSVSWHTPYIKSL